MIPYELEMREKGKEVRKPLCQLKLTSPLKKGSKIIPPFIKGDVMQMLPHDSGEAGER